MLFKKKKKDYSKESVFRFCCRTDKLFLNFYEFLINSEKIVESVIGENEYFDDFKKNIKNEIKNGLIISFKGGETLHLSINKHKNADLFCSSFYFFYQEKELIDSFEKFVLESSNLYYAVLTNYYDVKWQNEESIANYKVNNKSTKGLSYTEDLWGEKCIDISKNSGRSVFEDGISYIAGYCSWFSSDFKINLAQKSNADFAFSVTELKNNLLRVQLFEEFLPKNFSLIRDKQRLLLNQLLDFEEKNIE
ncbi:hypothetical protein ACFSTE_12135 [Aquimarina hainanensis]|uniref:Uncharacterized protein n=1 Tax=Aquimarina hainanensis TaxID=1578017 RepID=A0ABW5N7J2_9FLAO